MKIFKFFQWIKILIAIIGILLISRFIDTHYVVEMIGLVTCGMIIGDSLALLFNKEKGKFI